MNNGANRSMSFMISLGLTKVPQKSAVESVEVKPSMERKTKRRREYNASRIHESDIKWAAVRRYIRDQFLKKEFTDRNYKNLYKQAEQDGVDLECFVGKKVSLRSFATMAMRVRADLGLPSIVRKGIGKKIVELFDAGHSEHEIASKLECTRPNVYLALLKAKKIKRRPKKIY